MIKKILFGMHFWLPLLYTVVFVVISLIAGVAGGNWPYYFLGLSLSLFGSVMLTYVTGRRRHGFAPQEPADNEERTPVRPYEPVQDAPSEKAPPEKAPSEKAPARSDDEDEELRMYDERLRYTKDMKATPSQANGDYAERNPDDDIMSGGAMSEYYGGTSPERGYSDRGNGYFAPERQGYRERGEFSPYVQPANAANRSGAIPNSFDDAAASGREQPRIYRLKSEPNVLLYEYKDFFKKYYINPDGSKTLLSTEPKRK